LFAQKLTISSHKPFYPFFLFLGQNQTYVNLAQFFLEVFSFSPPIDKWDEQ